MSDIAREIMSRQKLVGADFKGWVGNGLQELQQAFQPGVEQIGPGTNATLGTVTTGEVTAERLDGRPMDVPTVEPPSMEPPEPVKQDIEPEM